MLDFVWKVGSRVLLGLFVATALALSASAQTQKWINTGPDKVAIKGYDTIAYFTESRAIKGSSEFEFVWKDARWHFSSAANRNLFAANPDRYAPKYGGFCAKGMVRGNFATIDPEAWTIADGKLYLNFTKGTRERWRKNTAYYIKKADENWGKAQESN